MRLHADALARRMRSSSVDASLESELDAAVDRRHRSPSAGSTCVPWITTVDDRRDDSIDRATFVDEIDASCIDCSESCSARATSSCIATRHRRTVGDRPRARLASATMRRRALDRDSDVSIPTSSHVLYCAAIARCADCSTHRRGVNVSRRSTSDARRMPVPCRRSRRSRRHRRAARSTSVDAHDERTVDCLSGRSSFCSSAARR